MDVLTWFFLLWGLLAFGCYYFATAIWPKAFGGPVPNHQTLDASKTSSHTAGAPFSQSATVRTSENAPTLPQAPSGNVGESCEWLNAILAWMFRYYRSKPEIVNAWLRSLNTAAKKVANAIGCEVVFEEVLSEDLDPSDAERNAPRFSNLRAEKGPRDHLPFLWLETLRGSVVCPSLRLQLVGSQKLPDRLLVNNYDAIITRLSGEIQMRIACIANELFVMACFDGRPQMDIQLKPHDTSQEAARIDPSLVQDAIRKCLMTAVTNISLTSCANFPQPVEEVFRRLNTSPNQFGAFSNERVASGNRLLVKVLRAQRLGAGDSTFDGTEGLTAQEAVVQQPYVTVEMDEPSQKQTTSKGLNVSPYWDEEFEFQLTDRSEELLFEVFDYRKESSQPKFLGLAIVGIEELRKAASKTHVLTLQSRPYQKDTVSGVLTVEFNFVDPSGTKKTLVPETRHQDITSGPDSGSRRAPAVGSDGIRLRSAADDLIISPPTRTTALVKSVSQYFQMDPPEPFYPSLDETGDATPRAVHQSSPRGQGTGGGAYMLDTANRNGGMTESVSAPVTPLPSGPQKLPQNLPPHPVVRPRPSPVRRTESEERHHERGRDTSRSRPHSSFFGDLKTKLGFRKKPIRTESLDREGRSKEPANTLTVQEPGGARSYSVPPSRDSSESRKGRTKRPSGTESGSDASGVSSDSVWPQSTLVVESLENNIKKYYLIPPDMQGSPSSRRMMKKGRKLHIFNEHIFVATRLPTPSSCPVCSRTISRGFGKSAYQCRDCKLSLHKRCHFKTETRCPCSTVSSLQIAHPVRSLSRVDNGRILPPVPPSRRFPSLHSLLRFSTATGASREYVWEDNPASR